jgi:hypothetical protein
MHTLSRFENRINKIIRRDKGACDCDTCSGVAKNGVIVKDRSHAYYLHTVEMEMGLEYRDRKRPAIKRKSRAVLDRLSKK